MVDSREVLFRSRRLTVTALQPRDVEVLLPVLSDPVTMASYGDGQPLDRSAIADLIASYPREDPRLLTHPGVVWHGERAAGFGGVGYYDAPGNTADVMVVIDRGFQRRGLGTELVRAAIEHTFGATAIEVVRATARPDNTASIAMLRRAGMIPDAEDPDHLRLGFRAHRHTWPDAVEDPRA